MSTEYPAENENEGMRCPSCGAELPPYDAYCSKCGARANVEPRRCVNCDTELSPQDAYCNTCGARNELHRRYSLWRVGILTFLTVGLYYLYWMYASWKHLAEEMPGKEFHPVWHALSQFVPIYNWIVLYQHFRTIKKIQEREGLGSKIRPGLVVIASVVALVIWSAAERAASVNPHLVSYAPVLISLVIITMIVIQGQANLNKYWRRPDGLPVRRASTGPGEVIISAVGVIVAAVYVVAIIFLIAYTPPGESVRLGTIDVGSAHRGTIERRAQVDAYRFAVRAGAQYTIYVSRTTLGLRGDPLEAAIVALWDSDGSTILQVENADTPIVIPWTASSSGTRYVTIESDGAALGDYVLEILEITATSSVSEADSFAPIQTSVGYRGTILSHLQVDSYGLPVQEGAGYAIYVVSRTTLRPGGDPLEAAIVALWDSDGSTILRTINADTPIVIPWTASSSGTRYVTIESDGAALGDYVLRVDAR